MRRSRSRAAVSSSVTSGGLSNEYTVRDREAARPAATPNRRGAPQLESPPCCRGFLPPKARLGQPRPVRASSTIRRVQLGADFLLFLERPRRNRQRSRPSVSNMGVADDHQRGKDRDQGDDAVLQSRRQREAGGGQNAHHGAYHRDHLRRVMSGVESISSSTVWGSLPRSFPSACSSEDLAPRPFRGRVVDRREHLCAQRRPRRGRLRPVLAVAEKEVGAQTPAPPSVRAPVDKSPGGARNLRAALREWEGAPSRRPVRSWRRAQAGAGGLARPPGAGALSSTSTGLRGL